MSISLRPTRLLHSELLAMLNKRVKVVTERGIVLVGTLLGYDPDRLHICLGNAVSSSGEKYYRVFISGSAVQEIYCLEKPLNLRELAERIRALLNLPKSFVQYIEEENIISIAGGRIVVTEEGVKGDIPLADKIRDIFNRYVEEKKGKA